ncbi:alpha/beta fold hydrolase [Nocardia heshunensis]
MRNVPGRRVSLGGNEIYLEESGSGDTCVVFESGAGAGRTMWDSVVPLLTDVARTVTYDRAGRGRSGPADHPQSIDEMATVLVDLVAALAPKRLILVAHSMGGLVARRAIEKMSPQPIGLVLIDGTPETAPVYDDWSPRVAKTDRIIAVQQVLFRVRPLARLLTHPYSRIFPADAYATMLDEDFTPAGLAQTRNDIRAVADSIGEFRSRPPQLPPQCAVAVIVSSRANRLQARNFDTLHEYQKRYAEEVGAQFEAVDSEHIVPAEQPGPIAEVVRRLLGQ